MKYLYLLICIVVLSGCEALKSGLVKPEFTALKANEDVNAIKVSGDIAPLKGTATISATVTPQIGYGNATSDIRTSVGGNLSNDSLVMKEYITALKENSKQQGKLYQKVILGLIAQEGTLILLLGWAMKKSMNSGDDDDRFKERMLERKISEQKMDDKIEIAKKEVTNV